ncbi:MAG TPA: peptidoglycan DD-metalloendopeptidase family protein [Methylomirabilota bacterium]|nr:peptidoglycan DD-metalloendopeptidase family protein [Methylomirabilota bacterium]
MSSAKPSSRIAAPAVQGLELGLIGETDGLDNEPGIRLSAVRRDRTAAERRALLAGFATLALVLLVTGALYSSIFLGAPVRTVTGPAPVSHPFELPEDTGPVSIIMEVRGDPIMIVRREDARPRPIRLALPAALADGPFPVDDALRIADTLISENGGFMGRLPDDASTTLQNFIDQPLQLTAEDIIAVMNPGAASDGDMTVGEYTLLEADIPTVPTERVSDADIASLVRATAIATGWVTEPRRAGGGKTPTAAILRELGSNTSRIEIAAGGAARAGVEEILLTAVLEEGLGAFLARNGFTPDAATAVEEGFATLFGTRLASAGSRLFIRARRSNGSLDPMQVSLYETGEFLGAVARADDGTLVAAEEPAFDPALERTGVNEPVPAGGYTVRDGLYSAAMRNAMPEPIVREAITVLARSMDLSSPARPGDRVEIVYSDVPRDEDARIGHVIFVGLRIAGATRECYVFRTEPGGPFGCLDASGSVTAVAGMIPPVKGGRLTSRFGMRVHPVLKYERLHKGIDWGAPKGTPIVAVSSGTLSFVGVSSGYGNYVKIAHDGKTTTAYAHMDQFEPGIAAGQKVAQGQRIGFLGSTGLSTGPHLHFEVYYEGQPVDPLTHSFTAAVDDQTAPDPVVTAAFADRKAIIDTALKNAVP